MKKIVYILLSVLAFSGCQKPEDTPPVNNDKIEVIFAGITTEIGSAKSTNIVDCDKPDAVYAQVKIDNTIYRPLVFYIDGVPYTQSIKLTPGTHSVKEFMLMNDNNTPENTDDDIIVSATPVKGSPYAVFVDNSVDFPFQVSAFAKTEVKVQVLCFEDVDYQYFGFDWFALTEIIVREQVFFGDICVANTADYEGSLYKGQTKGLKNDMPAIFRIDVYKNGAYITSYNNEAWLGEGKPLSVLYPDNKNANDKFDFNLSIYVRNGNDFAYVYYYTWTFYNDELITAGDDGVVDFVLGSCVTDSDLEINSPVSTGCQTAYAYGTGHATCFLQIQPGYSNWGWANGPLAAGSYVFKLYAGADQCNLENGREVGSLIVNYDGTEAEVKYNMLPGFTLDLANLYVGTTVLPQINNVSTTTPEEFPINVDLDDVSTATYTISGIAEGEKIYVIAHAKVCGPGL